MGKLDVGPRTFATVQQLLWCYCSPVCGSPPASMGFDFIVIAHLPLSPVAYLLFLDIGCFFGGLQLQCQDEEWRNVPSSSVLTFSGAVENWNPGLAAIAKHVKVQVCRLSGSYRPHPKWTSNSGEFWQNVVHWRREWQTTSVFLPQEPHEQYEKVFTPPLFNLFLMVIWIKFAHSHPF